MAKQRDHKAIYRARVERAKAQGFHSYAEKRKALETGFDGTDPDEIRRWRDKARDLKAAAKEQAKLARQQIFDLGGNKTLLTTTANGKGWGVIKGRLQGSGQASMTVILHDGTTRQVYGWGVSLDKLNAQLENGVDSVADLVNGTDRYAGAPITAADIASVQIEVNQ